MPDAVGSGLPRSRSDAIGSKLPLSRRVADVAACVSRDSKHQRRKFAATTIRGYIRTVRELGFGAQ
jgi:hypothetical protein